MIFPIIYSSEFDKHLHKTNIVITNLKINIIIVISKRGKKVLASIENTLFSGCIIFETVEWVQEFPQTLQWVIFIRNRIPNEVLRGTLGDIRPRILILSLYVTG